MDKDQRRDKHEEDKSERTLVAVFQSPAEARSAIAELHKAKYTHTWLGTTSIAQTSDGDEALTVESGGFFADSKSLVDALVSRGISGDVARGLEGSIEAGDALLTLDPKDKAVSDAADIIAKHGGRLEAGEYTRNWGDSPAASDGVVIGQTANVDAKDLISAGR